MEKYIISISIIVVIAVITFIIVLKKKKNIMSMEKSNMLIDALGGRKNIKSFEEKVSRINIYVKDAEIVDSAQIKNIANCGVVVVNNKIQIILKENVKVFHDMLSDV